MTPLERAARAIRDFDDPGSELAYQYARAVIEAIREPSEAMLVEAYAAPHKPHECTDHKDVYQAMIDTALDET